MKKQFIIAIIIFSILVLSVAVYISQKNATKKNNDAPITSLKEYSFDKIGIKFSVPLDMSVTGDDSQDDIFTVIIQRGNYPEQNYYQLYGILQTTSNPTFDTESFKKDLADGATDTTIGGFKAVQGQYTGERNNLVTTIFTNKGIFRLTTTPPSTKSKVITNSILDTLKFTFSDNKTDTQSAIQDILAKKYNRPLSEVNITVKKEAPGYSSGSVKFGQGGIGEGGVWLAVQKNGAWQLVFDGNGSVDCNKMRQEYGFPDIILKPDFCDSKAFEVESAVRAYVAGKAGVIEDLVIVVANYPKDWSDGCLGLGGPEEGCLAAITPGYEIVVSVNGREQIYRTNEDGSNIRQAK